MQRAAMFTYTTTINLHDTDAAGVIFFANQFRIAQEAFEAFLRSRGVNMGAVVHTADFALPVVHAEADYRAPLRVGDTLRVEVGVERIGETSVTMHYRIKVRDTVDAGEAKVTHVAIDRTTGKKRSLPEDLRKLLQGS